jgi:hypothetical protein
MNHLYYVSVDPSIDDFDGGLATLVLDKLRKKYMLQNFSCFLPFF